MESVDGYEHQGLFRQEFGEKYDRAYYAYEDGTLTIVLPGDLKISKASGLRITLPGSQVSNIAGPVSVTTGGGYTINGNLTVSGDVSITGNCRIGGTLTVDGLITSSTDVVSRGVFLTGHYHYGVHGNTSRPV